MKFLRKSQGKLTEGDITKTLFVLALPVIIGTSLQIAFNLTDTFFVGMLGADALAAISVTFPVVFIAIAIASGLNVGAVALISHAVGSGKKSDAGNISLHAIALSMTAGAIVAVTGMLFSRQIFMTMGIEGAILEMTVSYMSIIFPGFIIQFAGFASQGIIQSDGDTFTPMRNLLMSVAANAILDPLFIFGFGPVPAMGIMGAALATVLCIGIFTLLNFIHIFTGKTSFCISRACFKPSIATAKRILLIGLPSSISQSFNSIGMFLLMGLVGTFGIDALAAFGVGVRLESIAILPSIGLMISLMPFVGQNLGAGKLDRAENGVKKASYAVIVFMLFFSSIWFFFPQFLFAPFTSDPQIIATGSMYFRIISMGYVFLGLNFVLGGAMQAAGRTDLQLAVNLTRWVFIITFAYAFSSMFGLEGVWMGFPVGNLAGFLAAFALVKSGYWLKTWREKPGVVHDSAEISPV